MTGFGIRVMLALWNNLENLSPEERVQEELKPQVPSRFKKHIVINLPIQEHFQWSSIAGRNSTFPKNCTFPNILSIISPLLYDHISPETSLIY